MGWEIEDEKVLEAREGRQENSFKKIGIQIVFPLSL